MRISKLFSKPSKTASKSEDSVSGRLLTQAGYINKLASGSYDYLPLGFKVLKKIEQVIRREFDKAEAQEILSPIIHPAGVWQDSGRLQDFGPELVTFKNRRDQQFVLAPTHEETISLLGKKYISSYQDLPVIVNQIQTKYRDEPRPRGGLLRVREFIMQDAYSFDQDKEGLDKSYEKIRKVYQNIFKRCGLDSIIVDSDVGAMGGYGGEEFMLVNGQGEDRLIICPKGDYQANQEVATFKIEPTKSKALKLTKIKTPKTKTIKELCELMKIEPEQTAKLVFYTINKKLIAVVVRGDLEINETKLKNHLKVAELTPATEAEIKKAGAKPGFASPIDIKAQVIIDPTIKNTANLVIGANEKDFHLQNFNLDRDLKDKYEEVDIAQAKAGLACPKCGSLLTEENGIELGHIFKLGKKYSESLGVRFTDKNGKEQAPEMGCYGIGLGRLMAAVIEHHHDKFGIIWPKEISPFDYHLISLGKDKEVIEQADKLYQELEKKGKTVLYDDRDESAGVKFNDADLIGISLKLVISNKTIKENKIELSQRGQKDKKLVDISEL